MIPDQMDGWAIHVLYVQATRCCFQPLLLYVEKHLHLEGQPRVLLLLRLIEHFTGMFPFEMN